MPNSRFQVYIHIVTPNIAAWALLVPLASSSGPYFSCTAQSYSNPRHSVTTSEVRETPHYSCGGHYGSSDTTMGRSGAGLAHSSVIRGRKYDHNLFIPGYSGSS